MAAKARELLARRTQQAPAGRIEIVEEYGLIRTLETSGAS